MENIIENNNVKVETPIVKFFKKYWLYFASPILIIGLFFTVLYSYNVYPFSSKVMSNYDLLAQICPFYEHFFDVLDGKSSLFYSNAIVGGADVFGTLAYCAISPFTWLFLLCGKGNVYCAVSFVLPLKLTCISLSAIYFLRKRFSNIPDYLVLIISILYAYCGYTFVSNTYINWMDFLIYMPFVILGYEKLIKDKNIWYFAISYALMIYTCFSIACFALLMVFVIIVIYPFVVCDKQDIKDVLVKTCLACALAVALALPVILPSLFAYLKSGRNTGLFENINKDLSANHLYAKFSYIVSDTFMLVTTIGYFIKHGLKDKKDRFLAICGLILIMPCLVDEVCNLLNAGSYMSYALRFGFLNATYMLYVGSKLLSEFVEIEIKNKVKNVIFTILFLLVCVVAGYFVLRINNDIINDTASDFASRFSHSLGGLEYIAPISGIIALAIIIGYVFYKLKICSLKSIYTILSCLFAVQIAFYNITIVSGNTFNTLRYDQCNAILDVINTEYETDNYYRVKDTEDTITACFSLTTHTNSFSVFSSVIDKTNFVAPKFFNYKGNMINVAKSAEGNFFGDALLGYKYYYHHYDKGKMSSKDTKYETDIARTYIKKIEDAEMENFSCFENLACFPNAYTVPCGELKLNESSYCKNLEKLYEFLGGETSAFTTKSLSSNEYSYNEQLNVFTVNLSTTEEGHWFIETDFPQDKVVKYDRNSYSIDESSSILDDNSINMGYAYSGRRFSAISFYCEGFTLEDYKNCIKGYCLNPNRIMELAELLRTKKADYNIVGGDTYNVSVTANEGEYLFMNYVAIDGFSVTVNGKKAELIDNDLKFMLVKLEEGENSVVIKYTSPYIKWIIIGVLLGALIIGFIILMLKKPKVYNAIKNVIFFAGVGLGVCVLGFFFIYPTSVFFVKLVKLLLGLIF